jgi:hypothetical protein
MVRMAPSDHSKANEALISPVARKRIAGRW